MMAENLDANGLVTSSSIFHSTFTTLPLVKLTFWQLLQSKQLGNDKNQISVLLFNLLYAKVRGRYSLQPVLLMEIIFA